MAVGVGLGAAGLFNYLGSREQASANRDAMSQQMQMAAPFLENQQTLQNFQMALMGLSNDQFGSTSVPGAPVTESGLVAKPSHQLVDGVANTTAQDPLQILQNSPILQQLNEQTERQVTRQANAAGLSGSGGVVAELGKRNLANLMQVAMGGASQTASTGAPFAQAAIAAPAQFAGSTGAGEGFNALSNLVQQGTSLYALNQAQQGKPLF